MPIVPTRADCFDAGRRHITSRPSKIRRELVDTPGTSIRAVVGAGATMSEEVAIFASQAINEVSLATAAKIGGDVLDRAVFDRFGRDIEPRRGAGVARVYLSFSRPASGEGLTFPSGFRVGSDSDDGIVFALAEDAVMLAASTGPVVVLATCETAGPDGNAAAGTLVTLVDNPGDDTIVVTNVEVAAGGSPAETDEAFYARAKNYWAGARRGTPSAVRLGAESVQGVTKAKVTETLDPVNFEPTMRARVVISGEGGAANAALADQVRLELEEYRALGVPVTVIAGQPIEIDIVIEGVVFVAGANTSSVIQQMQAAIAAAVNANGPGETLYRQTIWSAINAFAEKAKVPDSGLVEPAVDLVPATVSTVIMTLASKISITS